MKHSLSQLVEIARAAVSIGAELLKSTRPEQVIEKSERDSYTDIDLRIEREIRSYLAQATPGINFTGEEEGDINTHQGADRWILDPIDGTANYVHQIPLSAVQIAMISDHEPIVAAISLPFADTLYWASKGAGAYANGRKLSTSTTSTTRNAIVSIGDYATGINASQKNKERIAATAALAEKVERVRMFGSAAHDFAWVAEGRVDAAVILSSNPVDVLPGILIAQEAGAFISDSRGMPHTSSSDSVIASAPNIANEIIEILSSSRSAV